MARQFAPKHFLRMSSKALVGRYFHERDLLLQVVFTDRSETDVDEIYEGWQALPAEVRATVDSDFAAIDSLASEEGTNCLRLEAQFLNVSLDPDPDEERTFHDTGFIAFLEYHEMFERARQFNEADALPEKYWYRRKDLPDVAPNVSEFALATFKGALTFYFSQNEGRGHNCVIDMSQRDEKWFFFCYLEDFGRADYSFEGGTLQRRARRPAFEVIFSTTTSEHSLDTYYQGKQQTRRALESLFARTLLGIHLQDSRSETVYELNRLKRRDFPWVYDLQSGITNVIVKRLRFTAIGGIKRRLTLEADGSEDRHAVYDFMDATFDTSPSLDARDGKLPLAAFNVTSAQVTAVFEPIKGRRRPQRTFVISYPNGCSLKHEGRDLVIRQMLLDSGIEIRPQYSAQSDFVGLNSHPQ